MSALPAGTVTFLLTDVEGSTRLLDELGAEAYAAALDAHRVAIREAVERHGGVEVDTQGDAFLVAFPTAPGALAAAAEAQASLAGGRIRVRMGVHTGTPHLGAEGYVGMDVHRAARIAASAHGGQVVVSSSTAALADGTVLSDLGEHRFKDLAAAERVFQLGTPSFPPLKSLYRTNLPVVATPFLGREREVAAVCELLQRDDVRLVTLTGPGGTGKTRLSLHAAAAVADDHPDGVTWAPLAPLRDPAHATTAIAQALEIAEEPGRPLLDTLVEQLAGKRRLLVLDNAEHLLPSLAATIARLRDAGGLKVMVTSRERLDVHGEHAWLVPPLESSDAVALFTGRARAVDPAFAPTSAVDELCRRLDNLPLAIELAAARTALFSVEQLLERLAQRLDLLKGTRDAEERHRTLRATIAWSHELLDELEQRLFARLSVFAGGCTWEAAEAVCEADPDTLQSLLDKSLVRRRDDSGGEPRYWMLETIRAFAEEQLAEAHDLGATRERLVDWAYAFAVAAEPTWHEPDAMAWIGRFRTELDNLRSAMRAAGPERLLEIAAHTGHLWGGVGLAREGLECLDEALASATRPDDPGLEAVARLMRAWLAAELGDFDENAFRECLPPLRQAGRLHYVAYCCYFLAWMLGTRDPAAAEPFLLELDAAAEELGNDMISSLPVHVRAQIAAETGDMSSARALVERLLAQSDNRGSASDISALVSAVELELVHGDLERARSLLVEAQSLVDRYGLEREGAFVALTSAYLALFDRDAERAEIALARARELFETSTPGRVTLVLLPEAALHALRGDRAAALAAWDAAEALERKIGEGGMVERKLVTEFLEPLRV